MLKRTRRYGTSLTAHNAFEVSLMHMYYRAFPMLMNASGSRSMSFSHETSGATVNETRCYGSAIGVSLEQVRTPHSTDKNAPLN